MENISKCINDYYYKNMAYIQDYPRIVLVLNSIVEEKNTDTVLAAFKFHYLQNEITQYLNKTKICNEIQKVIDEVSPELDSSVVTLALFGYERKYKVLTNKQKDQMKIVINIIENSKVKDCEHKILSVIPLLHGGGFTRTIAIPELICINCWLNVTLCGNLKEKGITINKNEFKKFYDFSKKCLDDRRFNVQSSSKIQTDPKNIYEKSQKYFGDFKIIILNKKLLENSSGV